MKESEETEKIEREIEKENKINIMLGLLSLLPAAYGFETLKACL
jgi:hypothetical protein